MSQKNVVMVFKHATKDMKLSKKIIVNPASA